MVVVGVGAESARGRGCGGESGRSMYFTTARTSAGRSRSNDTDFSTGAFSRSRKAGTLCRAAFGGTVGGCGGGGGVS